MNFGFTFWDAALSSSILESNKSVTPIKHRSNASKKQKKIICILEEKLFHLIFFQIHQPIHPTPQSIPIHRDKVFGMEMFDIVRIPGQGFVSETLIC